MGLRPSFSKQGGGEKRREVSGENRLPRLSEGGEKKNWLEWGEKNEF